MYATSYSANQYKANTVQTSPQQLVLMCYDGVVRFLTRARASIQRGEVEGKTLFINKAIAIIEELQSSLDFDRGAEIARNLDRIYDYFLRQLMLVVRSEDAAELDRIIQLVQEIRAAWVAVTESAAPTMGDQRGIMLTG